MLLAGQRPRPSRALPPSERNYPRGHLSGWRYPHRVSEAAGGGAEAALPPAGPAPRPGPRGLQCPAAAIAVSFSGRGPARKHVLRPRDEDAARVTPDLPERPAARVPGKLRNVPLPLTLRLPAADGKL